MKIRDKENIRVEISKRTEQIKTTEQVPVLRKHVDYGVN